MKKIIIIALFIFLTIILAGEIIILVNTKSVNLIDEKNSEIFLESYKYYTSQNHEYRKKIEKKAKSEPEPKEIKKVEKKEYEAKNLTTSEGYNEFLNAFINGVKSGYSKNKFTPIGNYEYITNYRIIDDNLALVLTDKNIYVKNGEKWESVSLNEINKTLFFTCGDIFFYDNEPYIIAGTSYSGIFYKKLKDKFLKAFNTGVKSQFATDDRLNFYETISSIYTDDKVIYVGYSYSKGIGRIGIEELINGKTPGFKDMDIILMNNVTESIQFFTRLDGVLYAESNYAIYRYNEPNLKWEVFNKKNNEIAMRKSSTRGIYINPYAISSEKKIDSYISLCRELGLNTFVVDFKDDYGHLTYPSTLEFAKKIGAIRKIINIDYLVEKCRENSIKLIARLVSFKDEYAYQYNNNELALWDWKNDKPWEGDKGAKWIDPYNTDYRKYLIDIGRELEQKGADEIQYDYVRFPSDGEIYNIKYRYREKGFSKNFLLYSFFSEAKEEISIPVSADFYGYNCWYLISANVGQDISLTSRSLDAVYPMFYPSHFVDGFYHKNLTQYERNFDLYYHGVLRTYQNSDYRVEVRPWIQTFKIKVNIPLKDYMRSQIEGLKKAGIDSYIFWSPSSNYQSLYEVFDKK